MDELLKMLIEAAEKEGKVHVIKKTVNKAVNKDDSIEKEAQELAHANKILYDAHIKEGFTSEEALALVVATLN